MDEEKPAAEKPRVLMMDGEEHKLPGKETDCCGSFARECPECGGYAHYQPVSGGYYRECEICHYAWY